MFLRCSLLHVRTQVNNIFYHYSCVWLMACLFSWGYERQCIQAFICMQWKNRFSNFCYLSENTCALNIDTSLVRLSFIFLESSRMASGYSAAAKAAVRGMEWEGFDFIETGDAAWESVLERTSRNFLWKFKRGRWWIWYIRPSPLKTFIMIGFDMTTVCFRFRVLLGTSVFSPFERIKWR